jgi:hypothetical protein
MKTSLTLSILAGLVAVTLAAPAVEARERSRSGSYATGGGKTGVYQGSVSRSPGAVRRQGSITTQDGRAFSRSSTLTYDRDTGAVNRSVTGAEGRTRTASGTYDSGTHTYDRTVTGANGEQAHGTTVYDRGTKSASTAWLGADGRASTSTTTYNAANRGFDTTVTAPDGKSYTRSSRNAWNPETGTLTRSVTGYGGIGRSVEITPDRGD